MRRLLPFLIVIALLHAAAASAVEPILVAEGTAPLHPQQPQAAMDEQGAIHLVYGIQNDVFYTRSADGKSFATPVKLPSVNVMSLGMRRGPRIAVSDEKICVTVIGGKQGKGRDGDLLAFHSDDGKTWSDPVAVNDVPDAAREGLHGMAAGPNGEFSCVWLDLRVKGTTVASSTSHDGGRTWSKNVIVYRSPSGKVCECCHPSIAYDPQGNLIALGRNSLNGERDMYYAYAAKNATEFGKAKKLGTGSWKLDHCPMDGGAMAIAEDGTLHTIWRRDKTLYTTRARPEEKLADGEQPVIAATSNRVLWAWLTKRGGDLMLATPKYLPVKVASNAGDPVWASHLNVVRAVLIWESKQEGVGRIYCVTCP